MCTPTFLRKSLTEMDLEKERTDGEGKKTNVRKLHLGRVRVSLE